MNMNCTLSLRPLLAGLALSATLLTGGCVITESSSYTPRAAGVPASWKDVPVAPLTFTPPKVERARLSNGIEVYLLEDRELPLFSMTLQFPYGSLAIPKDKQGLAGMLGSVWRTGGCAKFPGEALDDELEFLSASIGLSLGEQVSSLSVSSLTKDRARILEIAKAMLEEPLFPEERIELERRQSISGWMRRREMPQTITRRGFSKSFYGEHPMGWEATPDTWKSITRDDIVSLYTQVVGAKGAMIAVSGDFAKDEMLKELEATFGSLGTEGQVVFDEKALPPVEVKPGFYLIDKSPMAQVQMRWGHLGLPRHHPDHFPVQVYNEIFGAGGFSSRLMKEARSNRGLTYGIQGSLTLDGFGGQYVLGTSTKTETTREMYDVVMAEIEKMRDTPVTAAELEQAKKAIRNSFVFRYDSPFAIVSAALTRDRFGFPADWDATYLDKIEAVTIEDVQRVAREHTDPAKLLFVAVGPREALAEAFKDRKDIVWLTVDGTPETNP